jgi:predicted phage-related endonuclease
MDLGLTAEQVEARRHYIGGSDANALMSGDAERVLKMWRFKTGEAEAEDLSDVLPVMMGHATEPFNRFWFSKKTGRAVYEAGIEVYSPEHVWARATLDGMTSTESGEHAIFEAKHVNQFSDFDDVVQRYMPQLHHNMHCCQVEHAVISVLIGTLKWDHAQIKFDADYWRELESREVEFWDSVCQRTPPEVGQEVEAPARPGQLRTVDMTGHNEWASHAIDFRDNQSAAKTFAASKKALKALVANDVGKAMGHGVIVSRNKSGSLTIKQEKE